MVLFGNILPVYCAADGAIMTIFAIDFDAYKFWQVYTK